MTLSRTPGVPEKRRHKDPAAVRCSAQHASLPFGERSSRRRCASGRRAAGATDMNVCHVRTRPELGPRGASFDLDGALVACAFEVEDPEVAAGD